MQKRLAVFSGVLGNLESLNKIIKDIKKRKIEEIICLGDVLSDSSNANECLNVLRNNKVKVLLGEREIKYLYRDAREKEEEQFYKDIRKTLSREDKKYLKSLELEYNLRFYNNNLLFTYDYIDTEVPTNTVSKKGKSKVSQIPEFASIFVDEKNTKKKWTNMIAVNNIKNTSNYLLIEMKNKKLSTKEIKVK